MWQVIGNYDCSSREIKRIEIIPEKSLKMRFVRFSFIDRKRLTAPKLSEVKVVGNVAE